MLVTGASNASLSNAGGVRRAKRLEWEDGGGSCTPLRAMGWQMEREVSRGGESEAKALAEAGRGAVRAERGGAAADFARSATLANGVSAETRRP